ncbi:DUF6520 family protein [Penaeicola halotolerans]|uniref:DUF6520 family protein n=1 Tax=Penaeicola halotolerans TaxID=2793196 RepID=UPI001CF841DF|nr:DUF6520 family protein [Penaeicola halotolerans]
MKSLRLVFAALAFVIGAGFAFANAPSSDDDVIFVKVFTGTGQNDFVWTPEDELPNGYLCSPAVEICSARFTGNDPINGSMILDSDVEGLAIVL